MLQIDRSADHGCVRCYPFTILVSYILRGSGVDAYLGATVFGARATPSSTAGGVTGREPAQMDRDPVCGRPVDRAAGNDTVHFQGITYYFCTDGCRRAFESDPAEYLDPGRRPST